MTTDELYMSRALELAQRGWGHTRSNPMVGAVIVSPSGIIIGQGWHRRFGEGHAEVNAINSVKPAHKHLLKQSTIYVTLEPCSHYGKTPPCAKLIIDMGIPKVVVATIDPFSKVQGRGITMLRDAGVEVRTGVLEAQAKALNRHFFTAHTLHRPYVMLKWACSADGFMDHKRHEGESATKFSTPLTLALMHRQRAFYQAIAVGANTCRLDEPALTTRLWPGQSAKGFVITHSDIERQGLTTYNGEIEALLADLYSQGITTLMVEGGSRLLQTFINKNLWDEARIETSLITLGSKGAVPVPELPHFTLINTCAIDGNTIEYLQNPTSSPLTVPR